jgi:hypothetical protein
MFKTKETIKTHKRRNKNMKNTRKQLKKVEEKQKCNFALSLLLVMSAFVLRPIIVTIGFIIGTIFQYQGNSLYIKVDYFFDNLGAKVFWILIYLAGLLVTRFLFLEIKYQHIYKNIKEKDSNYKKVIG